MVNMARMPLCGSPTSQPRELSKLRTQVALPLIPILCSNEPHVTPLAVPGLPSSVGRNLGTRNRLMPRVPAGASGSLASTRCTMFSVRSWSPAEMKILVPVTWYAPSPAGTACVRMMPRSVPACASVRHIVPPHVPSTRRGRKRRLSSSSPHWFSSRSAP